MRIDNYQELAARTINRTLTREETMHHALHGMASEVGEIHGIFQKRYQGHAIDEADLKKEVGDCMWMLAEFCTSNGWKLSEICEMNIDKLRKRYPEGFSAERSINREE